MPVKFACQCGKVLRAKDKQVNKRAKCPHCGTVLRIPSTFLQTSAPGKGSPPPLLGHPNPVVHPVLPPSRPDDVRTGNDSASRDHGTVKDKSNPSAAQAATKWWRVAIGSGVVGALVLGVTISLTAMKTGPDLSNRKTAGSKSAASPSNSITFTPAAPKSETTETGQMGSDKADPNPQADGSSPAAMRKYADAYRNGQGVEQNYTLALSWYHKAADAGDARAMADVGIMYAKGWGVAKDPAEAAKWYHKAFDRGGWHRAYNLGTAYAAGRGVPRDEAQAAACFHAALAARMKDSAAGDGRAMNALGLMYAYGKGVTKDLAEALRWYRKGAEQGLAGAQINVGFEKIEKDIGTGRHSVALMQLLIDSVAHTQLFGYTVVLFFGDSCIVKHLPPTLGIDRLELCHSRQVPLDLLYVGFCHPAVAFEGVAQVVKGALCVLFCRNCPSCPHYTPPLMCTR
jgi:TPR repeat protein